MTTREKLVRGFAAIVSDAIAAGVPVSVVCADLASQEERSHPGDCPLATAIRAFGEAYEQAAPGLIDWQ